MFMFKQIYLFIFLAQLSFYIFPQTSSEKIKKNTPIPEDKIVATVNGYDITESEFIEYHDDNLKFVSAFRKVTKEASLNDLINKYLGIQLAQKNKLQEEPELQDKFLDILYHAQISRDLDKKFLSIKVSDKDIEKFYKENPEYRTSQILYRLRANPSAEEVAQGQNIIQSIYNELLLKPETFSELANRYSQSTSAVLGGDLGFQPRTRLTPEYFEQINGKPIGSIVKPFRSQYGWHIVKIVAVKKFDQIEKDLYRKIVYDIKRDKIIADYFKGLRSKAKIKIDKNVLENI